MLAGLATLIAGRDHRAAGGAGPLRTKRERVVAGVSPEVACAGTGGRPAARELAESGARRVVERRQLELDELADSIVRRDRRVLQALDQRARD